MNHLTDRDFDTLLAALRMWQARADRMTAEQLAFIDAIATEHGPSLTAKEIDALCIKLDDLQQGGAHE